MLLELPFFLHANFAKRKIFEVLALQVKNLLTRWKTKEKTIDMKNLGQKFSLLRKRDLGMKTVSCNELSKNFLI